MGLHKRANSHDVARLAGVSRSAVSRCFTPGASVSEPMRAKVMQAAQQLGYRANALARDLKSQQSQLVAILASRMDTPFRAGQVKLLSRELLHNGFRPLLLTVDRREDLQPLLSSMLDYCLSGMIVTSDTPPEAIIRECEQLRVPMVLINRNPQPAGGDRVQLDPENSAGMAFKILHDSGAQRLAALQPNDRTFTVFGRVQAFHRIAKQAGLECVLLPCADQSYAAGRRAVTDHWAQLIQCDGLFGASDLLACGAMDGLRFDKGHRIPEDIQIIGFDDIDQASWASYDLTTIRQSSDELARLAVALMKQRLDTPDAPLAQATPTLEAVLRATTRKLI